MTRHFIAGCVCAFVFGFAGIIPGVLAGFGGMLLSAWVADQRR